MNKRREFRTKLYFSFASFFNFEQFKSKEKKLKNVKISLFQGQVLMICLSGFKASLLLPHIHRP